MNLAAQEYAICVAVPQSGSDDLVTAVCWGKRFPVRCWLTRMITGANQNFRSDQFVRHHEQIRREMAIAVFCPKSRCTANRCHVIAAGHRFCPPLGHRPKKCDCTNDRCEHSRKKGDTSLAHLIVLPEAVGLRPICECDGNNVAASKTIQNRRLRNRLSISLSITVKLSRCPLWDRRFQRLVRRFFSIHVLPTAIVPKLK